MSQRVPQYDRLRQRVGDEFVEEPNKPWVCCPACQCPNQLIIDREVQAYDAIVGQLDI